MLLLWFGFGRTGLHQQRRTQVYDVNLTYALPNNH